MQIASIARTMGSPPAAAHLTQLSILATREMRRPLSFPKNPSVRICVMGQNQRIIRCDACDPSSAWDGYHQPV